jgi:hypothetical protein
MGEQLFGNIETAHGNAHAMLCIDDDLPDEFMIHLWGPTVASIAVLIKATWDGGVAHLIPTIVFRVSEGLWARRAATRAFAARMALPSGPSTSFSVFAMYRSPRGRQGAFRLNTASHPLPITCTWAGGGRWGRSPPSNRESDELSATQQKPRRLGYLWLRTSTRPSTASAMVAAPSGAHCVSTEPLQLRPRLKKPAQGGLVLDLRPACVSDGQGRKDAAGCTCGHGGSSCCSVVVPIVHQHRVGAIKSECHAPVPDLTVWRREAASGRAQTQIPVAGSG